MTISIQLAETASDAVQISASDLLLELSGEAPTVSPGPAPDADQRDLLGGVASIVTLVLAIDHVRQSINRRRLSQRVENLKSNLEQFDREASLVLDDGTALDLRRAQTDRLVDELTK